MGGRSDRRSCLGDRLFLHEAATCNTATGIPDHWEDRFNAADDSDTATARNHYTNRSGYTDPTRANCADQALRIPIDSSSKPRELFDDQASPRLSRSLLEISRGLRICLDCCLFTSTRSTFWCWVRLLSGRLCFTAHAIAPMNDDYRLCQRHKSG